MSDINSPMKSSKVSKERLPDVKTISSPSPNVKRLRKVSAPQVKIEKRSRPSSVIGEASVLSTDNVINDDVIPFDFARPQTVHDFYPDRSTLSKSKSSAPPLIPSRDQLHLSRDHECNYQHFHAHCPDCERTRFAGQILTGTQMLHQLKPSEPKTLTRNNSLLIDTSLRQLSLDDLPMESSPQKLQLTNIFTAPTPRNEFSFAGVSGCSSTTVKSARRFYLPKPPKSASVPGLSQWKEPNDVLMIGNLKNVKNIKPKVSPRYL
ncbi:hypothetical protein GEMRC1_009453 [Eukaryota sp. GEM-RC1]